jgi:hypothetical protein
MARGVRVLAVGFPPRRCLSSGVRPLCYIARSESYVARTWSWTISHSMREAQRPSELVASRHDAGPIVSNTGLRFQRAADHPRGKRHCGQGLVRRVDEPRIAPFRQGEAIGQDAAFRLAQRVTKHDASTSGSGVRCNMSSNRHELSGCPDHPCAAKPHCAGLLKQPVP